VADGDAVLHLGQTSPSPTGAEFGISSFARRRCIPAAVASPRGAREDGCHAAC
jgi:hypothetical protein